MFDYIVAVISALWLICGALGVVAMFRIGGLSTASARWTWIEWLWMPPNLAVWSIGAVIGGLGQALFLLWLVDYSSRHHTRS